MTLQQFVEVTIEVAKPDFDGFVPTIMLPSNRRIITVTGIPPTADPRVAVQEMIEKNQLLGQEFFVAVKSGEEIYAFRHQPGKPIETGKIVRIADGFLAEYGVPCPWWKLH